MPSFPKDTQIFSVHHEFSLNEEEKASTGEVNDYETISKFILKASKLLKHPSNHHDIEKDTPQSKECQIPRRFFASQTTHPLLVSFSVTGSTICGISKQRHVAYCSDTFQGTQGRQNDTCRTTLCTQYRRYGRYAVIQGIDL
jgi:hypothetical protein